MEKKTKSKRKRKKKRDIRRKDLGKQKNRHIVKSKEKFRGGKKSLKIRFYRDTLFSGKKSIHPQRTMEKKEKKKSFLRNNRLETLKKSTIQNSIILEIIIQNVNFSLYNFLLRYVYNSIAKYLCKGLYRTYLLQRTLL